MQLRDLFYTDNIIREYDTLQDCVQFQTTAFRIFCEAGLELHKWHANIALLEIGNQNGSIGGGKNLCQTTAERWFRRD